MLIKKKLIFIILLTFLNVFTAIPARAEKRCYGIEKDKLIIGDHNSRFSHCQKGDIVSAYTVSLKNQQLPSEIPSETPAGSQPLPGVSLRYDEVAAVCSFEHQIISVGETILKEAAVNLAMTVKWFDCVYIGDERDTFYIE